MHDSVRFGLKSLVAVGDVEAMYTLGCNSFEEVIRLAISIGGDSDTIGAMAGAIAACKYPIPEDIVKRCDSILTEDLKEIKDRFYDVVGKLGIAREIWQKMLLT